MAAFHRAASLMGREKLRNRRDDRIGVPDTQMSPVGISYEARPGHMFSGVSRSVEGSIKIISHTDCQQGYFETPWLIGSQRRDDLCVVEKSETTRATGRMCSSVMATLDRSTALALLTTSGNVPNIDRIIRGATGPHREPEKKVRAKCRIEQDHGPSWSLHGWKLTLPGYIERRRQKYQRGTSIRVAKRELHCDGAPADTPMTAEREMPSVSSRLACASA